MYKIHSIKRLLACFALGVLIGGSVVKSLEPNVLRVYADGYESGVAYEQSLNEFCSNKIGYTYAMNSAVECVEELYGTDEAEDIAARKYKNYSSGYDSKKSGWGWR